MGVTYDTETCDETTSNEQGHSGGSDLQDDTGGEDGASGDDGGATANPIGHGTGDERAEERACREDGNDEGLLPGLVEEAVVRVLVVGRTWSCC
jgi:hypothetical protein